MARHLFTARAGGVSVGQYSSLNFGNHVGDEEAAVLTNRKLLNSLTSLDRLQFMDQVHGNKVFRVTADTNQVPEVDALVTTEKSIGLVVMVADCLPILLDGGAVIGAVHVGRRGALNGIIGKTVGLMVAQGGVNIKAMIGPAICGKCYEVDEESYKSAIAQAPIGDAGFRHIDIRKIAIKELEELGCFVENIDICTKENENYFSYRRDGQTGRQAGIISL
jgi:YfiH family protein